MAVLLMTLLIFCLSFFVINLRMRFHSRSLLLFTMLLSFSVAFFGLAFYSEYISSASYITNPLFESLSEYIWKLDYRLHMDIYKAISLVNAGVLCYCLCALSLSLSFICKKKRSLKRALIALSIVFVSLNVLYNPYFMNWAFRLDQYNPYKVDANLDTMLNVMMHSLSVFIKVCILTALLTQLAACLRIYPRDRQMMVLVFVGLAPVHLLFLFMFYWYPQSSQVILWRYSMLKGYTLTMSQNAYNIMVYVCVVSIVALLYAAVRFDNFRVSGFAERVDFSDKMGTARMGSYVFTHSIKNYFVAIKLLCELAAGKSEQDVRKTASQIMEICDEAIGKVRTISDNLSSIHLNYELVDVGACIRAMIEEYRAKTPNIRFVTSGLTHLEAWIDQGQFKHVMDNLLVNAAEATVGNEGIPQRIAVEARSSFFRGIVISVMDNGTGVRKKHLTQIFHPFFSTKSTAQNWGVGLSYCKEVITSFGGLITASCKGLDDRGTTFRLILPHVWQCGMEEIK